MIKRFLILMVLCVVVVDFILATGASYIESNIHPVSINEKGEILCRTRFLENDMGSHRYMKIVYGYCVLARDSIYEYDVFTLDPDFLEEEQDYEMHRELNDSIFNSNFDYQHADRIIAVFNNKYNFTASNVDKYKVNRFYTLTQFGEIKKQHDISKLTQKALQGAKSISYEEQELNRVFVEYDFGNTVILSNKVSYECIEYNHEDETDNCFGAHFDYYYPLHGENMEYEIADVTGILFLTNN